MVKHIRTWSIEEKLAILKDFERIGVTAGCRKHSIYSTTYYGWLKKYDEHGVDGLASRRNIMDIAEAKRLRSENARIKKLLAERDLEISMKDELLKKKMQQWRNAKK